MVERGKKKMNQMQDKINLQLTMMDRIQLRGGDSFLRCSILPDDVDEGLGPNHLKGG